MSVGNWGKTAYIALLGLPKVGRKTARAVLDESEIPLVEDATDFAAWTMRDIERLRGRVSASDADEAWRRALDIVDECDRRHITVEVVPPAALGQGPLSTMPDPPFLLYVKGRRDLLNQARSVAIIGTRDPSAFATDWARRGAEALGTRGFSIVSGLAKGCDTAAHLGALDARAPTVAFLAHGLHTIYPKENQPLADRILAEGGCLASEYAPQVKAERGHFVERDRLQSGLSQATLVVQTSYDGGSMHTARFCRTQRRQLLVLAHPPSRLHEADLSGNEALLRDGATCVRTIKDLLDAVQAPPSPREDQPSLGLAP